MTDSLELARPFFSRQRTKRLIDELAHLDSLCVFAGAGVTIDRTEKDWKALVAHLLTKTGLDQAQAARLVEAVGPLAAGSMIEERVDQQKGQLGGKLALGNELRSVLYQNNDWLAGRVSRAIADLWTAFTRAGREVSIVTTNFDEHIELDIQRVVEIGNAPRLRDGTLPTPGSMDQPVRHLHGVVPENGEITDHPVISERDYLERSSATEGTLLERFSTGNVVIIGSGLEDRPLLNALLHTKEAAAQQGLRRYVIVPRSDLGATGDTADASFILHQFDRRLDHVGLTGVFVDHYAQIAQFLAEVQVAARLPVGAYPESDQRYGARLNRWWADWYPQNAAPDAFEASQKEHYGELLGALSAFRSALGAHEEDLKLELWLRWEPNDLSDRHLRLWASSFAQFSRWKLTRRASIDRPSEYASAKAFRAGRILYEPSTDAKDRWRRFVAIPLEPRATFTEEGEGAADVNLVVGCIVIASMAEPDEDSCLSEEKRAQHARELRELNRVGRQLAGAG